MAKKSEAKKTAAKKTAAPKAEKKAKPEPKAKVKGAGVPSILKSGKDKAKTPKVKTAKVRGGPSETNLIRRVTVKPISSTIQEFRPGDTVNVYVKVKEGEKERIQVFKGTVTKIQGSGMMKAFTVRKISAGVGVERTFPFVSPALDRVELVATGKVRRSKLYYLRGLDGKAAKIESELAAPRATEKTVGDETPKSEKE